MPAAVDWNDWVAEAPPAAPLSPDAVDWNDWEKAKDPDLSAPTEQMDHQNAPLQVSLPSEAAPQTETMGSDIGQSIKNFLFGQSTPDPYATAPAPTFKNQVVQPVTDAIKGTRDTLMNLIPNAVNTAARMTGHTPVDPAASLLPQGLVDSFHDTMAQGGDVIPLHPSPALTGLADSATKALGGFTSEYGLETLPLFESPVGRAAILADMASQDPAQIKQMVAVFKDPKSTTAQKWEAGGDAVLNLAMQAGLLLHMKPEAVKEKFSPEDAAKAVEQAAQRGGQPITREAVPLPPDLQRGIPGLTGLDQPPPPIPNSGRAQAPTEAAPPAAKVSPAAPVPADATPLSDHEQYQAVKQRLAAIKDRMVSEKDPGTRMAIFNEFAKVQAEAETIKNRNGGHVPEPPETTTSFDPNHVDTREVPLAQLSLSQDVPNFKAGADPDTGVVPGSELSGKYQRLGTAPILVWKRANGKMEVITGRHRFDLAQRSGEKSIPAQVVEEAKGFTQGMALTADAESNIRDGQGTTQDYAEYFQHTPQLDETAARAGGLLSRAKGQAGFDLARHATPDLSALWRADKINEAQALAITRAAPGNEAAQRVGLKFALQDKPANFLTNVVKAVMAETGGKSAEMDLFGKDDSAMEQMAERANRAGAIQKELRDQLAAVSGAAKRPAEAAKLGVNISDPAALAAKVAEIKGELDRWDDWPLHPDLVEKTKGQPTATPSPDLKLDQPESVDEQKARAATEAEVGAKKRAAQNLAAAAEKPLIGSTGDIGQKNLMPGDDDLFSATPKPPPNGPLGFGGGGKTAAGKVEAFGAPARQPTPTPVATTPQQLATIQAAHTPGLLGNIAAGIKSLLLPSSKSPAHLTEAERLGGKLGPMHRRAEAANTALASASKYFDRQGVHDERLTPANNPGIKFMSDVSQGRPMPARLQAYADTVDREFKQRLQKLEAANAPLQTVRDNYFPGMFTAESRRAFNAALEEAQASGSIPKDFDLNTSTPAQRAAVKTRVDAFLEAGKGSDNDMLSYLTRTPLAGKESFRKAKVFDDIMTAAEFGLRPVSNNPVDLVKGKLAELDRSIMAHEEFQSLKAAGKMKIINPYEEVPEGWQKVNDKYGTIYGKPTVTVAEHIDKAVYEGLDKFARSLGIEHKRTMDFPPGQGRRALGLSYQGQDLVRTKFATETSVLAHEIGHQLDHKYDLWDRITGGEKGNERKSAVQKELRAIADWTGPRGPQVRSKVEKIAQMVEAYVHAPEKMQSLAPTVFAKFDSFIKSRPELKAMAEIKPGIELTKLTSEKYVGLPIMGYRIVPDAAGDILNNYLSSSLYNNKYFGTAYKGVMGAANALNQTQLGGGSAFHAGFTTGESQVSAGAGVLKDVYGLLRGNRSPADLAKSAANWGMASIRTPIVGDRVLNAWRNPDGVINPKIAQVAKAAELAGGAFKMERGLETEQSVKMMRDWFSGHQVRAAARSPVALSELISKPIMQFLVPRQKAGVFAELASRIIEQNPGKDLEDLTPQFRAAWNRVDSRLGQVRYDRLFAHNEAKNVVQMLVRAPGWTGGTIAEIGGAFPDAMKYFKEWQETGKPPAELPDRVAYVASLIFTVGAINGALTYAFTGKPPQSALDYMAFRDGTKDQYGNANRLLLPSYMKDLVSYYTKVQSEGVVKGTLIAAMAKTHPAISVISDVLKNKDYYGYEVYDPHAGVAAQTGEKLKYVLKAFTPFWIRGVQKAQQQHSTTASQIGAFVGVMPAPGYITQSPMQRQIGELFHQRTGEPTKPYGTQDAKKKTHDKTTMDVYMFSRLPQSDQDALRKKMSPAEKNRYQ